MNSNTATARPKNPSARTWWQILWLLAQGLTATALSAVIGYRAYWIGQIAKRYNQQGPEGIHNWRYTTSYRPAPVLSVEQQDELRAAFSQAATQNQHWTGIDVAAWMSQRLGRPISYNLGWSYLVKLKHSQQRPCPQHALADPEEQEIFKKSFGHS